MPIIKSAQKKMRVDAKRYQRNRVTIRNMKSAVKNVITLAKDEPAKVGNALKEAYSKIDIALKKNVIHRNNAANKKSRLAKLINKSSKKSA